MIMMDPPDHTAMRKMVNRTFFRSTVAKLEDRVRQLCRGYLDEFVGAGGFDYVRDFSMKLPVMVISSLLGFPERDHDSLRIWSDAQLHRDEGNPERNDLGAESAEKLFAYIPGSNRRSPLGTNRRHRQRPDGFRSGSARAGNPPPR
jgi:cytochrome P450